MAKRKSGWTEEKIARYIMEGRGQGELSEYTPWLNVQDFSSNGNVTRLNGWKTKRQHEFFSNLERSYFFLLDWSDIVLDIREQFPLDRELTIKIAEEKGIPHSIDNRNNTIIPMTTDFFITLIQNKSRVYLARTVKPFKDLENPRVIEKFEIEREYWEKKGVNWGIVTEEELPEVFVKNIQWVHKSYFLDSDEDELLAVELLNILKSNRNNLNTKIIKLCNIFDEEYNADVGTAITYVKHLIARKLISFNMMEKIDIRKLIISDITFKDNGGDKIDYISG
ncbi:TnsA endonuclease N-terminal domain-containing protein [Lysinibacillus capsici]|uniref:TnsA endonuclease N-terminal domain-containing protein n=1 Tax=Lysinibacillus capsici TaxID=2115968 RepID=UPI00272FD898|nr:TnsA endonuclease N-terminal domain-containing protein [Lysinibacillus capsici]MDP1396294.1 TnsA endonuclease N-terminal domain-containing protein [Lysinibacillus capsici]MDP1416755.1 TnsA endonuclease N-terminal domain-containing protein [Lysinibacillus capsici]MDP1432657.1 TnsA endonuclease N-terminal domain-containing protein [Lysinibacillus capsici]